MFLACAFVNPIMHVWGWGGAELVWRALAAMLVQCGHGDPWGPMATGTHGDQCNSDGLEQEEQVIVYALALNVDIDINVHFVVWNA